MSLMFGFSDFCMGALPATSGSVMSLCRIALCAWLLVGVLQATGFPFLPSKFHIKFLFFVVSS